MKTVNKYEYLLNSARDLCKFSGIKGVYIDDISPKAGISKKTFYSISLITKGTGEVSVGQFTFPIKQNTIVIVPKREISSCKYNSADWSGYALNFNVDFFLEADFPKEHIINKKVLRNSIRPYRYLNESQAQYMSEIFECVIKEHAHAEEGKKQLIALKILELLIHCDRLFTETELIGNKFIYHPVIEKFGELLDNKYNSERSVQYYARSLNVHPNHLNFLLKKHRGTTAKQAINARVLLESKYLLSDPKLIIKDVAYNLGFEDQNNFSTFFQKNSGTCPIAYRSSLFHLIVT
jgi:AraC family transcriptional activator of pobA